jgi:hypothetical protein
MMMMMMRELVSILLHTRIQTRARPQEESKSSESTTESQNRKFPAHRAMMMNKERKTTTPRAHNPSRKDVNARIKRAFIHFDHFHARLSDRSTRTARISNAKPSFLHGGNHHLSSKSHKSPKTFARKEKKSTQVRRHANVKTGRTF